MIIASLTGEAQNIFTHLFGEDHKKSHAIYLEVPVYNDVKRRRIEHVSLEVEVGAAGQYNSFKQLGGSGRMVIPEGSQLGGTMLTCILDQQTKSWPYHDPEWQAASNTYMHHYLSGALTADLDAAAAAGVTVRPFATQAMVPFNSLTEEQSARGVKHYFLVTGLAFDEATAAIPGVAPIQVLPPAPAVTLTAPLLTGFVSQDGMTPLTAPVKFRLGGRGLAGRPRHGDGKWWPPSAAAAEAAHRAAAASSPGWAKYRTARRHGLTNKAAKESKARAREAGAAAADDDDGESVTSKLRRTDLYYAPGATSRAGSPGAESMPGMF